MFLPLLACAMLVFAGMNLSWAQENDKKTDVKSVNGSTPAKPKAKKGKEVPAKEMEEDMKPVVQGLGAFGQLLPLGRKNLDVQIPSFKDGIPSSILKAESLTRVDDSMMTMEQMDIWLYGSNRDSDMRVQLPLADYNMNTQILSSDERSRISRQDFQMEGDSMIFDTVTQQGKMTGRVEMIIFNTSSLVGSKPGAADTSDGSPAAPETSGQTPEAPVAPAPASASGDASKPSPSNEKK